MVLSSSVEKVLRLVEKKTGLPVHIESADALYGLTSREIKIVEEPSK